MGVHARHIGRCRSRTEPGTYACFLAEPMRLAYVVVAASLTLAIAVVAPVQPRTRGLEGKLVRRQRLAVVLLQVLGLALVVVAPWADRREVLVLTAPTVRAAGVVLFAAGQLVTAWAQVTLGPCFSVEVTIQKDHALVTRGLYRVVRHPRYLGILVFTSGFALVFQSGVGLLLVAGEALVLLWRIRDEEALLRSEFGARWDAYARRSWRLVPFVF